MASAGVVGLAIARSLTLNRPGKSVYLVERHLRVGEETRCGAMFDFSINSLLIARVTRRSFTVVRCLMVAFNLRTLRPIASIRVLLSRKLVEDQVMHSWSPPALSVLRYTRSSVQENRETSSGTQTPADLPEEPL